MQEIKELLKSVKSQIETLEEYNHHKLQKIEINRNKINQLKQVVKKLED